MTSIRSLHTHARTCKHTRTHWLFSLACSIFLFPPQQKDEVSSQLEVTPVDWTNGPEQAARIPRCHSSFIPLSKTQKHHTCPSLWISTSNSLQRPIRQLYIKASVIPLNTDIAQGTVLCVHSQTQGSLANHTNAKLKSYSGRLKRKTVLGKR